MHVGGVERLSVLVRLVDGESASRGRAATSSSSRLVEMLLIEALRSTPGGDAPPGLLRGLADARVARALRHMHGEPARPWTVAQLATKAALSRSAFFERFTRTVGLPPMEYLLAWRMAVAKDLLRRQAVGSPRWPSAWATARRAPSARRSAVMSANRRAATRASAGCGGRVRGAAST